MLQAFDLQRVRAVQAAACLILALLEVRRLTHLKDYIVLAFLVTYFVFVSQFQRIHVTSL